MAILDRGASRGKRLLVARLGETWYKRVLTRRYTPGLTRLAAEVSPRIPHPGPPDAVLLADPPARTAIRSISRGRVPFRERHPPDPRAARVQLVRLPRQGRGAGRVQALRVRVRPGGRLRGARRRKAAVGASSRQRPTRACCCARAPAASRTAAARNCRYGGEDYRTLRDWIAAGMPFGSPDAPRVVSLRVEPTERVMGQKADQQLKVVAKYSDGTREGRDAARPVPVERRSGRGRVRERCRDDARRARRGRGDGRVPRRGRAVPRDGAATGRAACRTPLPQFNFIDKLVDAKLAKLNVAPSGVCDDAEFLRRVFLDLTGTLPTPDEARQFLAGHRRRTSARSWSNRCSTGRSSPTSGRCAGPTCCASTASRSGTSGRTSTTTGSAIPSRRTSRSTSSPANSSPPKGRRTRSARRTSSRW